MSKNRGFKFTNQKKQLLTVDWLQLNTEDNFFRFEYDDQNFCENGSFVYELQTNVKTAHFNRVIAVYLDGEKVATITHDSNNPKILKHRAHIKLENALFYEGRAEAITNSLISENGLDSVSVSRLDLAVDGVYFHPFINKFLYNEKFQNRVGRYNDRDNITPVTFTRNDIKNREFDNFYIGQIGSRTKGTKKSYKFGRYYNKTKELREVKEGAKQYILDYYEKNALDPKSDIYRFELQFSSAYLKQLDGFKWQHVFQLDKMQQLLRSGCSNFFEFYHKDNKNVSRCTKIDMFKEFKESAYIRAKRVVKDKIRTVKIAVKRMITDVMTERIEQGSPAQKSLLNTTAHLVNEYRLRDWLQGVFPSIRQEIENEFRRINKRINPELRQAAIYDNIY